MTNNNSSFAERIAGLQARLVAIDQNIAKANADREAFGLGTVMGNELSQKAWRDIGEQLAELHEERLATAAGIRTLTQEAEVERKRLASEERQRQLDQARGIVEQLVAASREIDDVFGALRLKFEKRAKLTRQLAATGIMPESSAFGWNRPWKAAAAARASGLHAHISLERVDPQHCRSLAEWDAHTAAANFPRELAEGDDEEEAAA